MRTWIGSKQWPTCIVRKPCPENVNIRGVFETYNRGRGYGLWDHARSAYAHMIGASVEQGGLGADACTECGSCLSKCPQHINIPEQLKEAHRALRSKRDQM